jgi:hypothetical protein
MGSSGEAHRRHHFRRLSAEGQGKLFDRFQSHLPLSAFDQADMRRVKSRLIGQGFLRKPGGMAELPDTTAKLYPEIFSRHIAENPPLQRMRP